MWLFSKHGFFSAVQHRDLPDSLCLRARFKGDLQRLFKAHKVKGVKVLETPTADYRFRAVVKREDWVRVVAAEAEGIDYTNFKNRVHDGTARDDAYMDVWCVMRDAQEGNF